MDLFENIDLIESDTMRRRAATSAQVRVSSSLGKYLGASGSLSEFEARLAFASDLFNSLVESACAEHGYDDVYEIKEAVVASLKASMPQGDPNQISMDNPIDQESNTFPAYQTRPASGKHSETCTFTGRRPQAGEPWHMLVHSPTAFEYVSPEGLEQAQQQYAEQGGGNIRRISRIAGEDGDTFWSETVDLPSADASGLSSDPSPKMDKGTAGDENHTSQKPIEVPSLRAPTVQQDVADPADYTAELKVPGVTDTVNADTAMAPELYAGETGVFPNDGQANPVTGDNPLTTVSKEKKHDEKPDKKDESKDEEEDEADDSKFPTQDFPDHHKVKSSWRVI